ncbi:MAG: hypothetical protein Q9187_000167 [Circinaria calcarea]
MVTFSCLAYLEWVWQARGPPTCTELLLSTDPSPWGQERQLCKWHKLKRRFILILKSAGRRLTIPSRAQRCEYKIVTSVREDQSVETRVDGREIRKLRHDRAVKPRASDKRVGQSNPDDHRSMDHSSVALFDGRYDLKSSLANSVLFVFVSNPVPCGADTIKYAGNLTMNGLRVEPVGSRIQDYLAHSQDPIIAQRQAEQSQLPNFRRDQLVRPSGAGTSMMLSGNSSLAALTSEPSLSTTSLSSSIGIRSLGVPRLLESHSGALVIPPINPRTQFECPFSFQFCLLIFTDFDEWFRHSLKHFHQAGPPTFSKCGFCDMQFRDTTGLECWKARMDHVALHHQLGAKLAHARPDFELFRYLWNRKLIDPAEYKSLLGHGHRGEDSRSCDSPPLSPVDDHQSTAVTYTNTNDERRRRRDRRPRRT